MDTWRRRRNTLTVTDAAVAAGLIDLGERRRLAHLPADLVGAALARVRQTIAEAVDRMKPDAAPLPLIAVGGGSFLVPEEVPGISKIVRVEHYPVANAVGAAIAQVSGEVDQVFSGQSRERAMAQAEQLAREKALKAGAKPSTLQLAELEDLPLAYLPGNTLRVRARIIGDLG